MNNYVCLVDVALGLPAYDVVAPFLFTQADIVVDTELPGGAKVFFSATAFDDVDGPVPVTFKKDGVVVNSGDNFAIGTHVITQYAKDKAGNVREEKFTITVNQTPDVTPPEFLNLQGDITVELGKPFQFTATAFDNIDGMVPVVYLFNGAIVTDADTFPVGTNTITQTATDSAGNIVAETFDLIVEPDVTPPVITPQVSFTVSDGSPAIFNATAYDDVDGVVPVVYSENGVIVNSGDVFSLGFHDILQTATDSAGNVASQSFILTVV